MPKRTELEPKQTFSLKKEFYPGCRERTKKWCRKRVPKLVNTEREHAQSFPLPLFKRVALALSLPFEKELNALQKSSLPPLKHSSHFYMYFKRSSMVVSVRLLQPIKITFWETNKRFVIFVSYETFTECSLPQSIEPTGKLTFVT